jgi:hypothetical protein
LASLSILTGLAVLRFGSSTRVADFFAIGLRTGLDGVASALDAAVGAAAGLRPFFGLSSFSCTMNEGFYKSSGDRGMFEKI